MTEYQRLLADAENSHSFALFRLADYCEERGDLTKANGYRWLAKWKRWPVQKGTKSFAWYGRNYSIRYTSLPSRLTLKRVLSDFDVEDLHDSAIGSGWSYYETLPEALDTGAAAVGKWLDSKRKRKKPSERVSAGPS